QLSSYPCKLLRRSQLSQSVSVDDWEILLVDSVGELRWWWGLAEIAIVGGSFGDRGGQNMLEPAGYGANVAFGPNTSNFRDIVQLLLDQDAATRLDGTHAIEDWLRTELRAPELGQLRGRAAHQLIESQQGATQATIKLIRQMLDSSKANNSMRAA
ncbi:MAG: 3-deoxy-D-manno-octulosonic acid transferase, partial [bacterium]|nr:3-deoxy-D-manno-octulosonic acid transferase [bacterium]